MKLLLTSAGLSNQSITAAFLSLLEKPVAEVRLLMVAFGQTAEERFYIQQSQAEIEGLGIETTVVNMSEDVDVARLGSFAVIYVCGGNTFAILSNMRVLGLDDYIRSQVSAGACYVGVSAGSIIAGPDIEIAGWGVDGDVNDVGLSDTTGLGLTTTAVFPHFDMGRNRGEVEAFKNNVSYPVQELTDDHALLVTDSAEVVIG